MKSFFREKKLILTANILMFLLTSIVYILFYTKCFGDSCGSGLLRGIIFPLFWFGITASVISFFFLFFPAALFMSWLKKIASWYLPILFILTITTPVNSGHIMSVDRSQVVFAGMIILGIITLLFVSFDFYRKRKI